ncbi:hypothetical protein [Flavobacterium aquatile]|uniref:UDP-glycosyltransferase n=1 Tax=Flavobacterium aquatile LMG 4008 = ATCC 11947 TaxID=1453498 RepID=A0A095SUW9_9FLAO|nr:hypothetical protein [Flavobacterium aquatile]KGD68144.1 hypothetical protein LG45_07565 [Flavobacterium aquatile LMG 4008 = ATCC 11947]OXA68918.1 hypothetical protein B0A61_04225 [Flavobacterium aquatile LMG 4008 = ATCC 11947]GEC77386.1 hypothetical protein FAQ01_02560 [Flavobacterium aquatile]
MKKLGVVITDGVGFRNFILSDFLVEAERTFDEVVILSCLPKEVYSGYVTNSRIIELEVFEETFSTWFFRKAKEVAHLQLHKKDNFGIQDNLRANDSKSKTTRGYATRLIFKLTSVFHSEKWIQLFNFWQQKTFRNNPIVVNYKTILENEKFDLLFFTHQRPPFIAPLAYQAEQLKIKTASFIFSWDNLASKGRMAANFDYYLVWSDLMKTELQQFYTSVKKERIQVVGTPQFEPYVLDRYKVSKEEFLLKFNLDGSLKTICFSCGDISTSKNDELYIEAIANALLEEKIQNVNLIVRTSPAEDPIRFASFVERFSFIKWNYPKWDLSREGHQEVWSQRIPSVEDVKDLRSLLEFSDLNINMLSTMSLDFIQFDKPVINTVFGNTENGLYNDQRFLNYAHIENVVKSSATKIVKNQEELIAAINLYLENPNLDSQNRKQLLQLQVSKSLPNTGKRIAETLVKWI